MTVQKLTKKQRAVIDDLFAGQLDEQQILDTHKVARRVYEKWLTDRIFTEQFEHRLRSARRQGELIIARYSPVAAAKLVQLTESENQETARKACLDVINYIKPNIKPEPAEAELPPQLPPELACRLLAALANAKKHKNKGGA